MSKPRPTVLLIGLGHLGGVLLEFLARENWIGRVVACSRNRERGEARCNLARLGAIAQGLAPDIEYQQIDISRPHELADSLDLLAPDLVISTATMQTWWLPELLPPEPRLRLQQARFGMWLPLHLAPTLALMEAIAASSYAGPRSDSTIPRRGELHPGPARAGSDLWHRQYRRARCQGSMDGGATTGGAARQRSRSSWLPTMPWSPRRSAGVAPRCPPTSCGSRMTDPM